MPTQVYAGKTVDVDQEGFLLDRKQWSEEIGEAIAQKLGVALTPQHWKVISFVRTDTEAQGQSPGPRRITTGAGIQMKELYALFPKGPGKLVAQIAGVPKPKSCL